MKTKYIINYIGHCLNKLEWVMSILLLFFFTTLGLSNTPSAKQINSRPTIQYVLTIDTNNLSGYNVQIQLKNTKHSFQLAMATHNIYDDRFWRYVRNFRVETSQGKASYIKKDSALWEISVPGDNALIAYRIELPHQSRFAHTPFLSSTGGLVGDLHSFMYLVDEAHTPCTVNFQIPELWQIATGLEKNQNSKTFSASSAKELLDCPVLIGIIHNWSFKVREIQHSIAYLPTTSGSLLFDSFLLVDNIKKIVEQNLNLFGSFPYKNYKFLLEDGVFGALEHSNSVIIGAPATFLVSSMKDMYGQIAHEYSHTWNLIQIKPAEYTDLNYGPQQQSEVLWFSEGLTLFYADLLLRRAGLPTEDSTRIYHLEQLITRYYADTGNMVIPPAKVSLVSNAPQGKLGDYSASVHLQGELIGALLDMLIRNSTKNEKSFDDVMRLMFKRFGNNKGFHAKDIEQVVKDVCNNSDVSIFFKKYIYEGKSLDFNSYLKLIGLQVEINFKNAVDDKGNYLPDKRLYIWKPYDDSLYHLQITNPKSSWTKAGLHTNDIISGINDQPLNKRQDYNNVMDKIQIGDKVVFKIVKLNGVVRIPVIISGYLKPFIHIVKVNDSNIQIQKNFNKWFKGE